MTSKTTVPAKDAQQATDGSTSRPDLSTDDRFSEYEKRVNWESWAGLTLTRKDGTVIKL